MKISQLILREDFYGILQRTIEKNSFFLEPNKNSKSRIVSKSFKYLNIIISEKVSRRCRDSLVLEYTLSQSKIKMLGQKVYVFFAFLPILTNLFVHKRIVLPAYLDKYAIVGGNHRLRLFDDDLKEIKVLLKDGENAKFAKNDIDCRIENKIGYAPRILSYGNDWLVEEYISGIPFNRISDEALLKRSFEYIVNRHIDELILTTKKVIPIEQYLQKSSDEINSLFHLINGNDQLKTKLENTLKNILDRIKDKNVQSVEVSSSHGDFQKGNIRITPNNEAIVLDWEAADSRFYLYDLYVLFSGIREGKDFKYGINLFFQEIKNLNRVEPKYSKEVVIALLCLEEFRFNLNEDISLNYFNPGGKSDFIAIAIDNLLSN